MHPKHINKIGWFASIMAITMYFSYIDQIMLNLNGNPGSILLPAITTINCLAWTSYGYFQSKKDWPLIICSIPGVFFAFITALTAF